MREIKFRALVEIKGTDTRCFHYFSVGQAVPPNLSVVAWSEFTGLHDKNGKDIYEGDILKNDMDMLFTCSWNQDRYAFIIHGKDRHGISYEAGTKMWVAKYYQVIGNIYYKNPELMVTP